MTIAPYVYLLTFGLVAVCILLLLDRLERDRDAD